MMTCECDCNQIERLKIQVQQHELTIAQLVEMLGHTNRFISELTRENNTRTKGVTPHSSPSLSSK